MILVNARSVHPLRVISTPTTPGISGRRGREHSGVYAFSDSQRPAWRRYPVRHHFPEVRTMNTPFLAAAAVALAVSTAALPQDAAPPAPPKPDAAPAAQQTPPPPVKVMGKLVKVEGNDLVVAPSRPGAPS